MNFPPAVRNLVEALIPASHVEVCDDSIGRFTPSSLWLLGDLVKVPAA